MFPSLNECNGYKKKREKKDQKLKHEDLSKHSIFFVYLFNYVYKKSWKSVLVSFENEAISRHTCPKKQTGSLKK